MSARTRYGRDYLHSETTYRQSDYCQAVLHYGDLSASSVGEPLHVGKQCDPFRSQCARRIFLQPLIFLCQELARMVSAGPCPTGRFGDGAVVVVEQPVELGEVIIGHARVPRMIKMFSSFAVVESPLKFAEPRQLPGEVSWGREARAGDQSLPGQGGLYLHQNGPVTSRRDR